MSTDKKPQINTDKGSYYRICVYLWLNKILRFGCVLVFLCGFAGFCFAEVESIPHRSLCYFTAYLDEPSGSFSARRAHPEARRAEGSLEILPRFARQDEGSDKRENTPTPHLDNADSGRYLYFVKLGRLQGYGQMNIGQGGRPSRLDIISLQLGDSFSAQGKVDLAGLSSLDITLDINDMDLSTLFKEISVIKNNSSVKGIVNGKIRIDGKINIPRLNGRLQSRGLRIGNQDYNFAFVDLKGTWPLLFIEDGRLFYEGGYYILSGCVDLAHLPNPSAWKDVVLQAGQKNIRWMGWDIGKDTFNRFGLRPDGLNVERELKQDDVKVSLKTFINDEVTTKSLNSDALEIEYKMSNGQNIRMRLRQEDEFLGLEHKLKF